MVDDVEDCSRVARGETRNPRVDVVSTTRGSAWVTLNRRVDVVSTTRGSGWVTLDLRVDETGGLILNRQNRGDRLLDRLQRSR